MLILVVLVHALFGFTFTLGKLVVCYAHPLFAVGVRMVISGLILLGYIFLRREVSCYPRKKDALLYIQMAIFFSFLPNVLRLWALQSIPTIKASILWSTGPFWTAILSFLIHKERFSWPQILGLFIGFSGLVPTLLNDSACEQLMNCWWIVSLPELAVLAAIASMSYGLLLIRDLVKHRNCSPALANGLSMIGAGIGSLALMTVSPSASLRGSLWMFAGILALQVVVSNLFCSNLHAWLLKKYRPAFPSFSGFLGPLFSALYGILLFGESVSWHFFASFTLVVTGLVLYVAGERRNHKCASECPAD
jgi:drug/metabolite transporter (DMT)-like permease